MRKEAVAPVGAKRAAIYARKSTKQAVAEDAKSVTLQVVGGREFIAKRGWVVADVYEDDGVSGSLFVGRPGFSRLMRDAARKQFEVVVFFDQDRFGRNARRTIEALDKLADLGIEIWDYGTELPLDLTSFTGRMMTSFKGGSGEAFRQDIRKHTRDKMRSQAKAGNVCGGEPYGYRNVGENKNRTRVIFEPEADVIRQIYTRYASGQGSHTVAKWLNESGIHPPRWGSKKKPSTEWHLSTVIKMLGRPLYRGDVVYGRLKNAEERELLVLGDRAYERGEDGKPVLDVAGMPVLRENGTTPEDESNWIKFHKEEYRIVSEDLAARVDARRNELTASRVASQNKKWQPHKSHGKYLLSGLLKCPDCGASFEARVDGRGKYPGRYVCATRRRRPGRCKNKIVLPMDSTDREFLDVIEDEVLSPARIEELVALVSGGGPDHTAQWESERVELKAQIKRLVASIAAGVPPSTVAAPIREKESEVARLDVRLRAPRREAPNKDAIRRALKLRRSDWKEALRREPVVGRMLLRELVGEIELCPEPSPEDVKRHPEWKAAGALHWSCYTEPERLLHWPKPLVFGSAHDYHSPTGRARPFSGRRCSSRTITPITLGR